jgi:hypothetical protein
MTELIASTPAGAAQVQLTQERETDALAEKLERDVNLSESRERRDKHEFHADEDERGEAKRARVRGGSHKGNEPNLEAKRSEEG